VDKVHSIIKSLVSRGTIKKERIDESYRRIMNLKIGLNKEDRIRYYQQALEKSNQELNTSNRALQANMEKQNVSNQGEKVSQEEGVQKKEKKRKRKKRN
jgi:beta-N-acetylhexosaminidase